MLCDNVLLRMLCSVAFAVLLTVTTSLGASMAPSQVASPGNLPHQAFGQVPLRFEQNHGQAAEGVRFLARTGEYLLHLGNAVALWRFPLENRHSKTLGLRLLDASPHVIPRGGDQLEGRIHYLNFNNPSRTFRDVPTFSRVEYPAIYRDIDLVYYGSGEQLEYDFIVHPRGHPEQIRMAFDGAERIHLGGDGDLIIEAGPKQLRMSKPVAFQLENGARKPVLVTYKIKGNEVGFRIGEEYDTSHTLVIDPIVTFGTFVGNWGADFPKSIAVDPTGSVFIVGSEIHDFGPDEQFNSWVAKLNPQGTAFVYEIYIESDSTLFPQGGGTWFHSVAADRNGFAYIVGSRDGLDFTTGPIPADVFILKLDPIGNTVFERQFGGSSFDEGLAIAVDDWGFIYVTGNTSSSDFPLKNEFQTPQGMGNGFITKLSPDAATIIFSSAVGGSHEDSGVSVAVGAGAHPNVWVLGQTRSADFATRNSTAHFGGGTCDSFSSIPCSDIFVAKIDSSGQPALIALVGGSREDVPAQLALDSQGNVYIAGTTESPDLSTMAAMQTTLLGKGDGLLAKFDSAGVLSYLTYLGGSDDDAITGLAVDGRDNVYVTGRTSSFDFFLLDSLARDFDDFNNVFAAKIDPSGNSILYSTVLPGLFSSVSPGTLTPSPKISVDFAGTAHVAGIAFNFTASAGAAKRLPAPPDDPSLRIENGNGTDGGILKLSPDPDPGLVFTRVEQDDDLVIRMGRWFTNSLPSGWHSRRTAMLAVDPGSSAAITFDGTCIEWWATQDAWSGIARVFLDDVFQREVDTFSATGRFHTMVFAADNLPSGRHTLRIEVAGRRNPSSRGNWVWVDNFLISGRAVMPQSTGGGMGGGKATRQEQDHPSVQFSGTWFKNNYGVHSGGSAALALSAGARVMYRFTGTSTKWIVYRDEWSGIANVFVDGVFNGRIDAYASPAQAQAVGFAISGLTSGSHTLTIEVTGQRNPASQSGWIWIDAFEFTP